MMGCLSKTAGQQKELGINLQQKQQIQQIENLKNLDQEQEEHQLQQHQQQQQKQQKQQKQYLNEFLMKKNIPIVEQYQINTNKIYKNSTKTITTRRTTVVATTKRTKSLGILVKNFNKKKYSFGRILNSCEQRGHFVKKFQNSKLTKPITTILSIFQDTTNTITINKTITKTTTTNKTIKNVLLKKERKKKKNIERVCANPTKTLETLEKSLEINENSLEILEAKESRDKRILKDFLYQQQQHQQQQEQLNKNKIEKENQKETKPKIEEESETEKDFKIEVKFEFDFESDSDVDFESGTDTSKEVKDNLWKINKNLKESFLIEKELIDDNCWQEKLLQYAAQFNDAGTNVNDDDEIAFECDEPLIENFDQKIKTVNTNRNIQNIYNNINNSLNNSNYNNKNNFDNYNKKSNSFKITYNNCNNNLIEINNKNNKSNSLSCRALNNIDSSRAIGESLNINCFQHLALPSTADIYSASSIAQTTPIQSQTAPNTAPPVPAPPAQAQIHIQTQAKTTATIARKEPTTLSTTFTTLTTKPAITTTIITRTEEGTETTRPRPSTTTTTTTTSTTSLISLISNPINTTIVKTTAKKIQQIPKTTSAKKPTTTPTATLAATTTRKTNTVWKENDRKTKKMVDCRKTASTARAFASTLAISCLSTFVKVIRSARNKFMRKFNKIYFNLNQMRKTHKKYLTTTLERFYRRKSFYLPGSKAKTKMISSGFSSPLPAKLLKISPGLEGEKNAEIFSQDSSINSLNKLPEDNGNYDENCCQRPKPRSMPDPQNPKINLMSKTYSESNETSATTTANVNSNPTNPTLEKSNQQIKPKTIVKLQKQNQQKDTKPTSSHHHYTFSSSTATKGNSTDTYNKNNTNNKNNNNINHSNNKYNNNTSTHAYTSAAAFNCLGSSHYNILRNSINFYAASSVILVLCYLTTTTAATTNSETSSQLDKHPIKSIDWSKFDETSSDKEILDLLLEKKRYDKRLLPPVNDEDFCCGMSSPDMAKLQNAKRLHKRGTLTVNVNVLLLSLASPDESSLKYEVEFLLNQQWTDPRLQYGNKSHYEFLNALHHHDSIWTPDTYFIMHGDFKDPIIPMHFALRIFRNGTITYAMRRHLILSCQGSLHIFPFDDPKCSFSMESISYEEAQIKYVWKNDEDTLRKSPSLTTLNAYLIKNQTTACDQNSWRGNYSCLQVELTFTRDRAYYFTTVFIPGIILVTSSFITFWLEWNAVPARVMIGVTTMLNFFTTSNGFRSTLPVVSNLTAMNVWDGVCMCFIYASLLEFVCVNYFGRKTPKRDAVYRPGENVVTQHLPAVLSRIGVILASPLEIIEREFHAAVSSEKTATTAGVSKARKSSKRWEQQTSMDERDIPSGGLEETPSSGGPQLRDVSLIRRSRTISTNTPPLLVRRGSVHVDIHQPPDSGSGQLEATLQTTQQFPLKPPRSKSPRSSPSKITEIIEQASEKAAAAEESKDENSKSGNTCFVQVRKREPHHPIRVAKTIDVIARITFPTAYAIFLIFFFVHYKGFS